MARIRSLKPEFFTSEQVVDCSPTARLLFVGMWCFSDDAGIHPASYRTIKMQVFPGDDLSSIDIERLVKELEAAGLLFRYRIGGKDYFWITGWHHQKIEKPSYKYPWPDGRVPNRGQFVDWSATDLRQLAEPSPPESSRVESKGVEEKNDTSSFVATRESSGFRPPPPPGRPKATQGPSSLDHTAVRHRIVSRLPHLAAKPSPEIDEWLKAGCDVEKDIIPTIDQLIDFKQGDIGSFKFFTSSVLSARQARQDRDDQWKRMEEKYK